MTVSGVVMAWADQQRQRTNYSRIRAEWRRMRARCLDLALISYSAKTAFVE